MQLEHHLMQSRAIRRVLLHQQCMQIAGSHLSSPRHSCAPLRRAWRTAQAVVGAGAAGLAAAQQLRSEGHSVVVFEQGPRSGGVWLYGDATDDDPLGGPGTRVHSSMYR